jgi:hypothetical protein
MALAILAAMVFYAVLYKYTLRAWFQEDDFAWLGLRLQVHNWSDLAHALFAPMAQGTVRPLSERAFFMAFYSLFGLNALPSRIAVYVTELGNIALLGIVARSLTKSVWASFLAPVLWVANGVLAWPLTWTAAYNEILASFVFLLSFYALVRYIQTDDWRFNALQWASFLVGFGILEINVMYPLIALLYVVLFARRFVSQTAFLLLPSIAFTFVDRVVQVKLRNNIYALHLDASMFPTLLRYWNIVLGPSPAAQYWPQFRFAAICLAILLSAALLGFVGWRLLRSDRLPLFCLGWFAIAVAPFLPVRDHITDYYLTVPSIGLALLGSYAIIVGFSRSPIYRAFTFVSVAAYLACSIPNARIASRYVWSHSVPVKKLVLGVRAVHEKDPGKTIVLEGVGAELFWNGVYDHPFRLVGASEVYLTPDTVQKIPPALEVGNVADYTLPEDRLRAELALDHAVVYHLEDGQLREITGLFKSAFLQIAVPRRIELGHPSMDSLLDASWYASEGDFRWMPKEASVRLGAPASGEGELRVEAFCAPIQIQTQPIIVWVTIDGKPYARSEIRDCGHAIFLKTPVKKSPGAKQVTVALHVDRTIRVGSDVRDLGLAVRTIEIVDRPGIVDQQ